MDRKTLTALKGSIKKWEAIVANTGEETGSDSCPLCQVFLAPANYESWCEGCPVKERSGLTKCRGTPYEAFDDEVGAQESPPWSDRAIKLARKELAFLKSLLPKARP